MGRPFINYEEDDKAEQYIKDRMPEMAQYVLDMTPQKCHACGCIPWSTVLQCLDKMYASNDAMEAADAQDIAAGRPRNCLNQICRYSYGDIHLAVANICELAC